MQQVLPETKLGKGLRSQAPRNHCLKCCLNWIQILVLKLCLLIPQLFSLLSVVEVIESVLCFSLSMFLCVCQFVSNMKCMMREVHQCWGVFISYRLSRCVVNNDQTLKGHDLRCDFWCILHREVHRLKGLLTAMTAFKKPKRSILDRKIFNHWSFLHSLAFKVHCNKVVFGDGFQNYFNLSFHVYQILQNQQNSFLILAL